MSVSQAGPAPVPPPAPATGAARAEAPLTLLERPPRALGLLDQASFWGNLGISLIGFGGAAAVQAPAGVPPLLLAGALAALAVGTALGSAVLGASLVLGARTGAPAMVLLRGVLGRRAGVLPTVLNVVQCLGWGTFELVVIARGLGSLTHGAVPRWAGVLLAGSVTVALTLRPLGVIRLLRRYVAVLVVGAAAVLAVDLLTTSGAGTRPSGTAWTGFWLGVDAALAVAISWVPLGADYSRHSTSSRSAFTGGFAGLGATQIACYGIGLLALERAGQQPDGVFDVFLGLPLGLVALAVLVLRESDQSFANVYSTAVSLQNLRPAWDRRVLTAVIGAVTVTAALVVDIDDFSGFLYLIGAVFVPLSAVLLAAWLRTGGRDWDVSATAPTRPAMLAAWAAGFVAYQLANPGVVDGWSPAWTRLSTALHVAGHPWLSASITSFALAAAIAYPLAGRRADRSDDAGSPARPASPSRNSRRP